MQKIKVVLMGMLLWSIPLFGVPENIETEYQDICWSCYNPEIPVQNFLTKYRETLRNLCYKKDARACEIMANLYAKIGDDIGSQEYWQRACKLGIKNACPMVQQDDKNE